MSLFSVIDVEVMTLMCCLCVVCMRTLYTKLDRLVSKSFTCLLIKPKVKDRGTNRSCPSPVRSKQQCLAGILQHLPFWMMSLI